MDDVEMLQKREVSFDAPLDALRDKSEMSKRATPKSTPGGYTWPSHINYKFYHQVIVQEA